ncbi:hypothetical protein [Nocardia beijingensis]|uniref:hypothetical protein n=1 Tax=Nocardia beijingensis TaxID=95162 RepID=UPI00083492FE|nr:hypothetical protein [Nocardia beijingensis]
MNPRSMSVLAALVTATVVGAGSTSADASPALPSPVTYSSSLTGDSVTTTLAGGTFALSGDGTRIEVRDTTGQVLDALPTTLRLDGQLVPIHQLISVDGSALVSTPDLESIRREDVRPVASPLENQLAMNDLINSVSIGTSIGSLVGTAIGAAIGVGVGLALAGASCVVLSLGCVVAVLPIVSLVGAVGGLTGLVVAGGPTAAVALYEYVTILRTPPGESKYAPHLPNRTQPTPDVAEETR